MLSLKKTKKLKNGLQDGMLDIATAIACGT